MQSNAAQAGSFIPILHSTLASNNLGNIKMTCCDATGWAAQTTLTNGLVSAGMEQYLSVFTSHMYSGDPNTPLNTKLKVWETEAADLDTTTWCTTWYSNGGICEGMTWASKISTGILNANLSAYLYWEGVEPNTAANSYLVNAQTSTVSASGRLWAFAMWSRFIRPGAYRVQTTGTVSSVAIGAFKNTDGSIVVVFTNSGGSAQSIKIGFSGFTPSSATGYLTDNSHQVASTTVTLSGGAVTVSVGTHAVVTVVMSGGGSGTTVGPTSTTTTGATTTSSPGTTITTTTTTTTTTTATPAPTTTSSSGCTQALYGQCAGMTWKGCTICATGSTCKYSNPYYSQCL